MSLKVNIKKLHPEAIIPKQATRLSAGFDLHAIEDVIIQAGKTKIVKTGIAVELPEGFEMQIRPRSGNSLKTDIRIANAPGTIDADYRGEIGIIIDHRFNEFYVSGGDIRNDITIKKGDRIAQGVISRYETVEFIETEELSETERGSGGFGSTGK